MIHVVMQVGNIVRHRNIVDASYTEFKQTLLLSSGGCIPLSFFERSDVSLSIPYDEGEEIYHAFKNDDKITIAYYALTYAK